MSKLGSVIGFPIHSLPKPDDRLPVPSAKIGIEVEIENWNGKNTTKHWVDDEDGSLRGGREFMTDGPVIGVDIISAVEEICAYCTKNNYSTGEPRAGIHVHLDCTDCDMERNELALLVSNYLLLEHAFFGFAGVWRDACGYCVSYESGQIDFQMLGQVLYNTKASRKYLGHLSKYQALNLRPLSEHGTIEFRHLPTTFDKGRIMDWIRVILALKRSATNHTLGTSLLQQFSEMGPIAYAEKVLGMDCIHILRPYLDPARMWAAVDNATAIMAHGNVLKQEAEWGKELKPNPILKAKFEMIHKPKAKKQVIY